MKKILAVMIIGLLCLSMFLIFAPQIQAEGEGTIIGDVNNDGKVDIKDLEEAGKAFGSYLGHPRWNPIADLNQDDKVDIIDLATIAINFGKISS
jgi:hypothetical protein